MLVIALLVVTSHLTSSTPVPAPVDAPDSTASLTVFGRELPECVGVARHRTLQNIVWSCLTTILACVWVSIHPNVPNPRHTGLRKFSDMVRHMYATLVTPEAPWVWALKQRTGAIKHAKAYNAKFYPGVTTPTRSILSSIKRWCRGNTDEEPCRLWTTKHGFLLEMHGLVHATGKVMLDVDEISEPLDISEEQINARSKSDLFTKSFAIVQTTWFILQILARWTARLPVTELEVSTLAFALVNIAIYYAWWDKPQGMSLPIQVHRTQSGICRDCGSSVEQKAEKQDTSIPTGSRETSAATARIEEEHGISLVGKMTAGKHSINSVRGCILASVLSFVPEKMFFELLYTSELTTGGAHSLCFSVVVLMVGGLHLVPLWSSSFPSSVEKMLWQYCVIWTTIWPILLNALMFWAAKSQPHHHPWPDAVARIFYLSLRLASMFLVISYALTRSTIIILAFATLRNIPPDAYRNIEWTTFIPHI